MLAKNLILDLLLFSASQVPQYYDLQRNSRLEKNQSLYNREILDVLDAILYSKVQESHLVVCVHVGGCMCVCSHGFTN